MSPVESQSVVSIPGAAPVGTPFAILIARGVLAVLAVALLATGLRDWPAPWIDDGLHLGAAAVLARDGVYGVREGGVTVAFDPQVQVGPAVIGPVALGLRLFGTDVVVGRSVMALLSLGALLAAYALARRVFDERTALLTVALLLLGTREMFCSPVFMGRQVLGEVPAFGFYMAGMWLLVRQIDRAEPSWIAIGGAGLAWGLAMLSKAHLLALLPVAIGLLVVADYFYYRRRAALRLIAPVVVSFAVVALWQAVRWGGLETHDLRSAAQVSPDWITTQILTSEWLDRRRALGALWRSGFLLIGLPGLVWAASRAARRDEAGLREALLLAVPVVCLTWYVGASIGWARYAFYPVAMSAMWAAALVWMLWDRAASLRLGRLPARMTLAAGVTTLCLANGAVFARAIAQPPVTGFDEMRGFITAHVPADAPIETWEWEFSLDDQSTYTHPGIDTMLAVTRLVMSNRPTPPTLYDWRHRDPAYVLVGPFGAWTGIYRTVAQSDAELVAQAGHYRLYRVRPELAASHHAEPSVPDSPAPPPALHH